MDEKGISTAARVAEYAPSHRLALFDLDHTLLPLDSNDTWVSFLTHTTHAGGPEEINARYARYTARYDWGTRPIKGSIELALALLALHTPYDLALWHEQFMASVIRPAILLPAIQLVQQHLSAGDLCVMVTATNHFVTAPIARAFGVPHLIATLPEYQDGRYTGRILGTPSFKEGKVIRVKAWLAERDLSLASFSDTCFYSDSLHDLPLLEAVNRPIATNPSPALREIAQARDWQIIDLFARAEDEKSSKDACQAKS